jgi:hypothetical protein
MKMNIDRCWGGNSNYHIRATINGDRYNWSYTDVEGAPSNRAITIWVRDIAVREYRVKRNSVKCIF